MSLSRKIITGLTGWLGLSNRFCWHDWEAVEVFGIGKNNSGEFFEYEDRWHNLYKHRCKTAINRVCLKCGKCDLSGSKMVGEYVEYKLKKIEENENKAKRNELAKKIYSDGCKNS